MIVLELLHLKMEVTVSEPCDVIRVGSRKVPHNPSFTLTYIYLLFEKLLLATTRDLVYVVLPPPPPPPKKKIDTKVYALLPAIHREKMMRRASIHSKQYRFFKKNPPVQSPRNPRRTLQGFSWGCMVIVLKGCF